MKTKKPELLSPVQDFTSLKAAIDAGADAVYFGLKKLNMRAKAKNFSLKELKKVIEFCHKNNVKAYLTLNSIVYDNEIKIIKKILKKAKNYGIDGVICWDFSVIDEADKLGIPIHVSTQASVSNFNALKILKKKFKNIKRVILARELSLEQIKKIIKRIKKEKLGVEVECFIHGAMCVSISGRCLLSHFLFGKSANRGECLQPCRRRYILKDVEEDYEIELGEGRNRAAEYVKVVTECYREAIDNYKNLDKIKNKLLKKLKSVYNRGFSSGFYLGKPLREWTDAYGSKATKKKVYVGKVLNYYRKIGVAEIKLEACSLKIGDEIMFQGPTTGVFSQKVDSMEINHKKVEKAEKGSRVGVKTEKLVRENDLVFLIKKRKN